MSLLLCVASCHWFSPDDEVNYERTVLVFMAAENSLSFGNFHEQDLNEIFQAAGDIPENSRLLVYLDDLDNPRILSFERQPGQRPIQQVVCNYDSEQNSGDVETLRTVMEWVCDSYPSSSYGLIFWSHGDAWLPAKATPQRSICIDNGRNNYSNSGSRMDIADVADVLAGFPRFEFILFDACFMQAVEVAYELRHVARHVIASPAEIPNPGAPYERMVKPFFNAPFDGTEIVEQYYRMYNDSVISVFGSGSDRYGVSLSVIDCSYLDALADATAGMITKYVSRDEATDLKGIQRYYPLSSRSRPEFYDMNGYMRRLITDEADYLRWKSVFDLAVPYARSTAWWYSNDAYTQRVDLANYGGVSCYVPQDRSIYDDLNEKFRTTSWYMAAGWHEVGW